MGKTAEQIKSDMRTEVEAEHTRIAQQTASKALRAVGELIDQLRFKYSGELTRGHIEDFLLEYDSLGALLAECAASLPPEQPAEQQEGKAA